jgi:ribonuclease HI
MKHQGQGLPQCSKQDWQKELAKEISEAKWKTQNIHNHPYQTALDFGQHSGLNKSNKLPNDHPQAPEGPDKTSALISTDQPHNCSIDEAPQSSSSQNLTRKVKDWRDWAYTDGSLQKNEVGQDTESGVHHPHLNVSHYVNPNGLGITNTISRAELAAIAAAVIHGYSHIATDSLASLHQIKKQLSHPNLHRHHIQGDVLQSIAKTIRQSPSPIYFFKVKSHASIIGNEHAGALAIKSATTYSNIADISIKTAGPEGNPFYNIHWLAKENIENTENQTQTHNHAHTTNMAHSPPPKLWYLPNHRDALQAHMHLLHKLKMPNLKRTTMRTTRPS